MFTSNNANTNVENDYSDEFKAACARHDAEYAACVAPMHADYKAAVAKMDAEFSASVARMKAAHEAACAAMQAEYKAEVSRREAAWEKTKAAYAAAREKRAAEHEAHIASIRAAWAAKEKEMEEHRDSFNTQSSGPIRMAQTLFEQSNDLFMEAVQAHQRMVDHDFMTTSVHIACGLI